MRAFLTALGVAFVAISALADNGRPDYHDSTGTVIRLEPGDRIEFGDGNGACRLLVDARTVYENRDQVPIDPGAITRGVRVRLWHRSDHSSGHHVVEKVRVLDE